MKKLVLFLMVAIPLFIVFIVNFTVSVVIGDVYISVDKIELDKTSIVANVDDRISLQANIYPENATNQDIIWKSDNEDVAKIDSKGNVVFVGFGSGYITATSSDGNKMAKCYFYVTDTNVHKVELSSSQTTIEVGNQLQLTATISPSEAINKNLYFYSSDETIATVDSNGLVFGLSAGNVTITVQTEDGGFIDSLNLQIVIPVKGIVLSEKEVITSKTFYNIAYKVIPENATNKKINFKVDNEQIASVSEMGIVEFKKAGTVYVTLFTADSKYSEIIKITSTDGYANELNILNTSVNLEVGDSSVLIDYSVVPLDTYNTEVMFSSNNEKVVFVDENGYLTAVGGGDAIITVMVEKSSNSYIIKQVYVHVDSPAKSILIEDIITAQNTVTLFPVSYPADSTNTKFFYHSENTNIAEVDSFGQVTFLIDTPQSVDILIYANEDFSDVYKRVNILFTAGKVYDFKLLDKNLELEYGQSMSLNYTFEPKDSPVNNVNIEIISETNKNGVVKIESDGSLFAIGGGECFIKVSIELYNGKIYEEICNVIVNRKPEGININLDLEMQDGQLITAQSVVNLFGSVFPDDSSFKQITWSVNDKNVAVIVDNVLNFNQTGTVILTATCENVSSSVEIFYTGSYPLSANLGVLNGDEIISIPDTIYVGETFEILIKDIFPQNTSNKNISLRVVNQITSSINREVISISNNSFTGVNGGVATLIVTVSNSLQYSFEINVIRLPEEIEIVGANQKTTQNSFELIANVYPLDTTNSNVTFSIIQNNNIAYLKGNELVFISNGKVKILAVCEAEPNVFIEFYIEKVEKEPILIDSNSNSTTITIGDLTCFDIQSFNIDYDYYEIICIQNQPLEIGENVLKIDDDIIRAQGLGQAIVCINFYKNSSVVLSVEHTLIVEQYVEEINFSTNLDIYNNEYVTAVEVIELNFDVLPESAKNKNLSFKIIESYSSLGLNENIAYLNGGKIFFIKAGVIVLEVSSQDLGGYKTTFRIRYTAGDALDAEITVDKQIYLSIGESIKIDVNKWIPHDTINTIVLLKEIGHTSNIQVVKIDNSTNTITALNGGVSQIIVELSNGITKEITINVLKLVTDIKVENEEILTALSSITLNASALPSTATNKNLSYELIETDIATISGNIITFNKAGTVYVKISATDGSGVSKTIKITSSLGFVENIVLNYDVKTINKGNSFALIVSNFYPNNATNYNFVYEIVSFKANDGSLNSVISINENGLITGLLGGEAIVRVYCFDYYGNVVEAECKICVNCPVESIDITFNEEIDNYLNLSTFVTGKNQIEFYEIVYPSDATCRDFIYEISDSNIAEISGNKIIFKQKGSVVIKFINTDTTRGEKSKTYTFVYTGDDLLEVDIDRKDIINGRITIKAGEVFAFNISTILPSNCSNIIFYYKNIVENRIDISKEIGEFNDNTFTAYNGGEISFDLVINNLFVGSFTICVEKDANDIFLNCEENIYISQPSFNIIATALPSDTNQTQLAFVSSDISTAKVNGDGSVEFYKLGRVAIRVYVVDNPNIYREITIEYTKELQNISFSSGRTEMYVGEYVDFEILANPLDCDQFELELSLSNSQIAEIIIVNGKYRLIGIAGGKVVVTAKVVGKDISASKEFVFYPKITDIQLELDKIDDSVGLGQYRYFGNKFFDGKEIINTYQMNVSLQPSNDYVNLLVWSSSDPEIATVDQNGLVTVLKAGKVTITVKQIAPYDNAATAYDYYEFTFIDGVNIFNSNSFYKLYSEQKEITFNSLILHVDITNIEQDIVLNFNLFGNGHLLDFSSDKTKKSLVASVSNKIVDNITIRGRSFSDNSSLSDLEEGGNVVSINNNAKNITFNNCIIENAQNGVHITSGQALFSGCIFRNTFYAGIKLTKTANTKAPPEIVVKDCIFGNSLLAGILYDVSEDKNVPSGACKVTLIGEVRFYCWKTLDEMGAGFSGVLKEALGTIDLSNAFNELVNQTKQIFSNYTDYKYTYNGQEYYNIGIVSFDISVAGYNFSSGEISLDKSELNASCNYSNINVAGTLTLWGLTNADFDINILTLPAQYPFIKPGDTYIGNQYVLGLIRQPKPF